MEQSTPPPVISSARVLAWASTAAPVRFTGRLHAYRGDVRIGEVPHLVLAESLRTPGEIYLIHCSDDFEDVFSTSYATLDEAKERAEQLYAGVTNAWTQVGTTVEQAKAYLTESNPDSVCTFCGRMMYDVNQMIATDDASICDHCIREFYEALQESDGPDPSPSGGAS